MPFLLRVKGEETRGHNAVREWVRVVQYLHGYGMPRGARRIHNQREWVRAVQYLQGDGVPRATRRIRGMGVLML